MGCPPARPLYPSGAAGHLASRGSHPGGGACSLDLWPCGTQRLASKAGSQPLACSETEPVIIPELVGEPGRFGLTHYNLKPAPHVPINQPFRGLLELGAGGCLRTSEMGQDQLLRNLGSNPQFTEGRLLQGGGGGQPRPAADHRLVCSPLARPQLGAIRLQSPRRARISQEEEIVGRRVCVRPGGVTPHPHAAGQIHATAELAPRSRLAAARSAGSLPAAWCSRPSRAGD